MASHLSSPTKSISLRSRLRRKWLRKVLLETLERRELLAADSAGVVFAPGTSQDYMDSVIESYLNGTGAQSSGESDPINLQGSRWVNPTGGLSANQGDPAIVSWSIVPDGTIDSANNSSTNLVSFMDGIYGGGTGPVEQRPWFNIFERAYDRWSEVSGLTFVYEANDDGAPMGGSNRGVTGVRGDVRIGGRNIDGNFGVLAFNYYPNNSGNGGFDGDMIIDTNDVFYLNAADGPTGENRGLSNVVMHEAGHGIGLAHTIPIDSTKLMEPNITFAFLGPQHDDILGANILYGDDAEINDSQATATDLGQLGNGIKRVSGNTLDADNDEDWLKLSVSSSGKISVLLEPIGFAYSVGPQGGTASGVDTKSNQNLAFTLRASDGSILADVSAAALGQNEELIDFSLPAGGDYFLQITGTGAQPQMYDLAITLKGLVGANAGQHPPRLLSVAPNVGSIFSFNRVNNLNEAPNELTFRFDGAQFLDASSLDGIRITRSGGDNDFSDGDEQVIVPGWIGFGESDRVIKVRFAEPLPDDAYSVEVFGVDIPAEGITAVTNLNGEPLRPRLSGTDRDTMFFDLELGAQVVAVVPQPITSQPGGTVTQARDQIEVYFNDDDLHNVAVVTTGAPTDPTVVKPEFYQLILTADSVTPSDDQVFYPTSISYDPATDKAVLTFASDIDQLAGGAGTFRLRIGSNDVVNSVSNPPVVTSIAPGADPAGFRGSAYDLGPVGAGYSSTISESLVNVSNALELDFPGSNLEPGHRDIQDQNHLGGGPDSSQQITQAFYNFALDRAYGVDTFGQPVFTSITPEQIERVREIYEFYSAQLGIDFVESERSGMTVVVGDMFPNGQVSGPGGVIGVASLNNLNGLAIMDGAETWDNSLGADFFGTALHEIGHMLGLGHTYELPLGTVMGSTAVLSSNNPLEEQYPGDNDITHGQYIYRPDNKDVDLYRFEVPAGVTGEVSIETIAERLTDSSNADTHLTLFKQTAQGLEVVATNNDYFSSDSFLRLTLDGGTYFVGVTVFGNEDFDPVTNNTGAGGVSQGRYQLRVDFEPAILSTIVDTSGTELDGDGDGLAGGNFNFWFRAVAPVGVAAAGAPQTFFVNKDNLGPQTGSPTQPFRTLSAATAAVAATGTLGHVIRVAPSLGADGDVATVGDNRAYEIGRGGVGNAALADGLTLEVPRGTTLMVDAGAIFKMGGSRIVAGSRDAGIDRSFSSIQVLGTPDQSIVFTSYDDEGFGIDTNTLVTTPQPGQWGGIEIHNDVDREEGRGGYERRGIFLNYLAHTDMRYGGGQVTVSTPSPTVNPIDLSEARPTLLYNTITFSSDSAIAADPNSFEETRFTEPRYQLAGAFRSDYERVGPDIRGNRLLNNSINGLFIRTETPAGNELQTLEVQARFDDTDIVHVLGENLIISGTPGGSFLETTAPDVSLVTFNDQVGSLPAGTQYDYKLTFVDLVGGLSIPSVPTALATATSGGVQLNNLPGATGDFVGRRLYRSSPGGGGTYTLVAELDGDTTTFRDLGQNRGSTLVNPTATSLQRARLDARLAIDPGVIIKSLGARIEVGISAQLIAEGNSEKNIVFTSRLDDRFGAGGTFDTGNDGNASAPRPGDWGGLIARQTSSISVDSALITYGGGVTSVPGGFAGFNAIEIHQADGRVANSLLENNAYGMGGNLNATRDGRGFHDASVIFVRASQPVLIDNVIQNNITNNTAAISVDANSMKAVPNQDTGRQTGFSDRLPGALGNMGPLVEGNRLTMNGLNGMHIRGATLTTETVWDDSDIVHILQSEIVIPDFHTFGGMRLQSKVDESLVVKLGSGAGITAAGLPLDITDRIGGSLQIIGTPGFPVVLTSINDDSVGSGFDPTGIAQVDTNSDGFSVGSAGDWRSIRLEPESNDRNVETTTEQESDQIQEEGVNDVPLESQNLGSLAASINAGDENLRLGFTVHGAIASTSDLDVYSFVATAGTPVWLDIDRTDASLDSVIELIDVDGNIIAQSNDSLADSKNNGVGYVNPAMIVPTTVENFERNPFATANSWLTSSLSPQVLELEPNDSFATPQDLDGEQWYISNDPEVENSGTRPYVSIAGTGDGTFDYYSFTATAGTTGTFDIDNSNFDNELFLFDSAGNLVVLNDDNGNDPGSVGAFLDAQMSVVFPTTGTYILAVGEFNSFPDIVPGTVAGNVPDAGDNYILHVSVDGKSAIPFTVPPPVATDFQSTNPADAGFRVVLPGATGAVNTYYVRVRSSNVAPGQSSTRLQDPALIRDGLTRGAYRLQLRMQQSDEIGGSTIRFADIRYASTGVEAIGLPGHSPLLGNASQGGPAVNTPVNSTDLGNIANTDRAGMTAAGDLATAGDVDWYRFTVSHTQIQSGNPHVSTVFDIDYADGFGRPNTSLWVYRVEPNDPATQIDDILQLILIGSDSDIADDRAAPQENADLDDLSRGSFGSKDAFIGSQELLPGEYLVAVSNNSLVANQLRQFQEANSAQVDPLVRLEPIDSVQRIVVDRFENAVYAETAVGPQAVAFNGANLEATNSVPWTLGDVTTFVVRDQGNGSRLFFANTMTGAVEAQVGADFTRVNDLAMSPDGRLVGYGITTTTFSTDANSQNFLLIDSAGDGATADIGDSGIQTFTTEINGTNFVVRPRTKGGNSVGDGIEFNALTFFSNAAQVATGDLRLFGVGQRGDGNFVFDRAILDANNAPIGRVSTAGEPTNIVYRLDPTSGAVINPNGFQDRTGNFTTQGAGTQRREFGRLVTADPSATVTGIADVGASLVAVSEDGELFVINIGTGTNFFGDRAPITTVIDTDTGLPIAFTGLTTGPQNLEGGRFANILFGSTQDGTTYAFNTAGVLQNIFPGGTFKIKSNSASLGTGIKGLDFSPLDVNLWHLTNSRGNDAGHGRPATPVDNLRPANQVGQNSLYFGFENAGADGATRQQGDWDPIHSVYDNTYALPGGAHGAIESLPLDLRGYSIDDLPTLYFNYYLETQNQNSPINDGDVRMEDAFRVYAAGEDGQWILLSTNNSSKVGSFNSGQDEFDVGVSQYFDANGRPLMVQEAFDVGDAAAPDAWRQVRATLAPFAGQENVRIRFEFSSGASFRTGDELRGGVELTAVDGWQIDDGDTFVVSTSDQTVAQTATFEFDLGLVVSLPSGASIQAGAALEVDGVTYPFTTTNGVPNTIFYQPSFTPAQVAAAVQAAIPFPVTINSERANIVNIDVPAGTANSATGLPGAILGLPGVSGTNFAVKVTQADTAVQIRDAVRAALAQRLNVAGQGANLDVWPVYGETLRMFKYTVDDAGPLKLVDSRIGDLFGVDPFGGGLDRMDERAQNNAFEGVFIDDIIVGLAERGEAVFAPGLGFTDTQSAFSPNLQYEPSGFGINEAETGRYQLDIRLGADYGWSVGNRLDVSASLQTFIGRTFDSNDRLSPSFGFEVNASAGITDGAQFTLSDGIGQVTFEFDVVNAPTDPALGVSPGTIAIRVNASDTSAELALKIRDAINSSTVQNLLNVSASVQTGGTTIVLHGPAAITRNGSTNLTQLIPSLSTQVWGNETSFGEDHGDTNRLRDQGVVVIQSTVFSNSANYGVVIDAAPRAGGAPNTPGSPIYYPTNNSDRLAPGVVVMNNVFDSNLAGGLLISGDPAQPSPTNGQDVIRPSTIARVVNNTFYGRKAGDTGIRVNEGASPIILNNILAHTATGIDVAGAQNTLVLGANLYYDNNTNVTPGGTPESFRVTTATNPFVDPTNGNFYLVAGSEAIDSSLEVLAELASLTQVKSSIGLPPSPTLAPDRDVTGQRRVDDPTVTSPGVGSNVFKDRGAYDRADVVGLEAVLLRPLDNDSENVDVDRTNTYLRIVSGQLDYFSILLLEDEGTGPDNASVTDDAVIITENGRLLNPGVDYVFGYNANSRTIRLTPLSGLWRSDSVYEITLNNRSGIRVTPTDGVALADGDTFTINAGGSTLTFEYDSNGNVAAGSVAVPFKATYSQYQMAAQIMAAVNRAGSGLGAYLQGDSAVMITGATSVGGIATANVGAIRDIAGNALQANRPTSLTQFTIVMPEVQLDYGDAPGANSTTLQANNGARHALLPIDAPLLALGAFADGDANGSPSASATGDDNQTLLLPTTSVPGIQIGSRGPASLSVPSPSPALDGQQIIITDPVLKSVTFEFDTNGVPSSGSVVAVDVSTATTAVDVANALRDAVNTAVLQGRITALTAFASGATVNLGGTRQHIVDISAAPQVTRLAIGTFDLLLPAGGYADGQRIDILDGQGQTIRLELNDTASASVGVALTSIAVDVDLGVATAADVAQAFADVINQRVAAGTLALGPSTANGSTLTIAGDDEDGVSFGGLFNAGSKAVPVTVTATGAGILDVWFDWNADGDFIDGGERIVSGMPVEPGDNVIMVTTPATAAIGFTATRFRLSTGGNSLLGGLAVGGEVEDHLIEVVAGAPPVANDDAYSVDEDTVLTVPAQGVLTNDVDTDSASVTVLDEDPFTAGVQPLVDVSFGTLVLNANGSFTYTPDLDFFGTDTFVYNATDPRLPGVAPATVTITVNPVNDRPTAIDDEITILEDEMIIRPGSDFTVNDFKGVFGNPSQTNELGQTLEIVNAVILQPNPGVFGGTVSVVNNELTYTPPAHYNNEISGPVLIALTIRDGGVAGGDAMPLEDTSTLTINLIAVNDAPEFTMPLVENTVEDAGLVTVAGFVTDIRPGPVEATDEGTGPAINTEDQQVSFVVTALDPTLFAVLPTITPTTDANPGTLSYQLAADVNLTTPYFPEILVEVIAVDTGANGGANNDVNSAVARTFTILPTVINDAPEFTIPATTDSIEDQGLVTVAGFMTDIRPGPQTALDEAALQSLSVSLSYDAAAFTTAPAIDLLTGDLTYETAPHVNSFTGQSLEVVVTVTDDGGLPDADQTTKTFTIQVTEVNDAPEYTMPTVASTTEDAGPVTVAGFVTAIRPGPVPAVDEGVLREDQQVSFTVTALDPTQFVTLPAIDASGTLTYELVANLNNVTPFPEILVEVVAVDTGAVGGPNNDVNTAVAQTFTIVPVAINDAPEFTITAPIVDVSEDAGLITIPDFIIDARPGPVTALDELAAQLLSISVVAVDPSAFTATGQPQIVLDPLTGKGVLTFETNQDVNNFTGHDLSVIVTLMDDGGVAVAGDVDTTVKTFALNIAPINDSPLYDLPVTDLTFFEDQEEVDGTVQTVVTGFATNILAGPTTALDEVFFPATLQQVNFVTVSVSDPSLFAVQPAITPTGDLTFTTAQDQNGQAIVVVHLLDDGPDSTTGNGDDNQSRPDMTFTINLTAVNDAPEFTIPATTSSREDQGLVVVPGFATNLRPGPATAGDETGQQFTVHIQAVDPSAFTVQPALAADGTLTYQTGPDVNRLNANLTVQIYLTDDGTAGPLPDNNTSPTSTFTIDVAPINDEPTFVISQPQVNVIEDVEQFLGVGQSSVPGFASSIQRGPLTATDEFGQTLTFEVLSVSAPELFAVQPAIDATTGELTFTTAQHKNGKSLVVVRLVDDGVASPAPNDNISISKTFTISIAPINDAPQFDLPATITVDEDAGLTSRNAFATNVRRGPVGSDDENSQLVSFQVTALDPSLFTVQPSIGVDGTLTFETAPNVNSANANLQVTVRLVDNGLNSPAPNRNFSDTKTFTVIVNPVNDPPSADLYTAFLDEDSSIVIQSSDVLFGDVAGPTPDELFQSLRITQVQRTSTAGGSIVPVIDGTGRITSFTYTPPINLVGGDTFLYVVTDDGVPEKSGTGTISITIAGINDAPQFNRGPNQTVPEDVGPITVANWATNILAGPPAALDELASQMVSFTVTALTPGLFQVQPSVASDGTLTYTPAKDANGSSVVVVTAIDSGSGIAPNVNTSAPQTFTITISAVNDAPVYTSGGNVSVQEDSGAFSQAWATSIAAAAGLLATPQTAQDEATQGIDFEVSVDQPQLFSIQPRISSSGVLEFTPVANAYGQAVVVATAVDRGPAGALDNNRSTPQTFTITINPENDAPVAEPDAYQTDEDTLLTVAARGLLVNDTDVDLPLDTLTAVAGTYQSDLGATVVINADGSMTYDPLSVSAFQQLTSGQSVSDTFVYQVRDAAGATSAPATVVITVDGIDDAPLAVNDSYSIGVGQTRNLDVLTNDTDVDSTIDPRTIVITANPGFGSVSVNQTGVVVYQAEGGFRGVDTFSYTVKDSTGKVSNEATVTVTVNSAPLAAADSAFTFKNEAVEINVLANDTDADGSIDPSTVRIEVSPTPAGTAVALSNGRILFTPALDFAGQAQFSYSVQDNVGTASNVATVRVQVQNSKWQNPQGSLDINADGFVSPIDALIIINYLNGDGEPFLPNSGQVPPPYLDPSGDEMVTPLDVLLVTNYLNANSQGGGLGDGEGEAAFEMGSLAYAMTVTPQQIVETVGPQVVREIQSKLNASRAEALVRESGLASSSLSASTSAWGADEDEDDVLEILSCSRETHSTSVDDAFEEIFGQVFGPSQE